MPDQEKRILYCRCAYAQVVEDEVKNEVLKGLCTSGISFDSVADLCEMAARKDARLKSNDLAPTHVIACHARAVKWLFHQAEKPLDEAEVTILNMREESAEEILTKIQSDGE